MVLGEFVCFCITVRSKSERSILHHHFFFLPDSSFFSSAKENHALRLGVMDHGRLSQTAAHCNLQAWTYYSGYINARVHEVYSFRCIFLLCNAYRKKRKNFDCSDPGTAKKYGGEKIWSRVFLSVPKESELAMIMHGTGILFEAAG